MKRFITSILLLVVISVFIGGCGTTPQAEKEESSGIESTETLSPAKIKEIALADAAVSEKDSVFQKVEMDAQDDKQEYTLVFEDKTHRYEYRIDAVSGGIKASSAVLLETKAEQSEQETKTSSKAEESSATSSKASTAPSEVSKESATSGEITVEQAKKVALEHAGVAAKNATFHKAKVDYDDGKKIYEIEFYVGNIEYDYDISMDGKVLSYDQDIESFNIPASGSTVDIGEDKAKNIALAKVPGADNSHIRIKKDNEDGRMVYEGEILFGGKEYDFEIEASTGTVTEWSVEAMGD